MRRRRQYDATGAVQRESLAETAEILQAQRGRHRAAGRPAADRARADRAPDRGHAALACSTTSGTSRRCWTGSTTRASGHARRRSLLEELREVLTLWWQTDELRRIRPRVEDEVRRNLFFFEAVLFDAVPAVLGEIEHALAVRLVQPVLSATAPGPAATWTATPRSAPTRWRGRLQLHRTTALRLFRTRVDRPGARVLALVAAGPGLRGAQRVAGARRARSCPAPPSCAARTASGSRCGPSSASSTTGSATRSRRAGASPATPTRRRCGATSSSCSPIVNSRHVALGSIRRLLWQIDVFGFHLAGIDIRQGAGRRARGDGARSCPATPTPTSRAARRC